MASSQPFLSHIGEHLVTDFSLLIFDKALLQHLRTISGISQSFAYRQGRVLSPLQREFTVSYGLDLVGCWKIFLIT